MKLLMGKSPFKLCQNRIPGKQNVRAYKSSTFKSHSGFGWGTVEKHETCLRSAHD